VFEKIEIHIDNVCHLNPQVFSFRNCGEIDTHLESNFDRNYPNIKILYINITFYMISQ